MAASSSIEATHLGTEWKTRVDRSALAKVVVQLGTSLTEEEDAPSHDEVTRGVKEILMALGIFSKMDSREVKKLKKVFRFLLHPDKAPTSDHRARFTKAFKFIDDVMLEIEHNMVFMNFTSRGFKNVRIRRQEFDMEALQRKLADMQKEQARLKEKISRLQSKTNAYKEEAASFKRKYEEIAKAPTPKPKKTLVDAKAYLESLRKELPIGPNGRMQFGKQYELAVAFMAVQFRILAAERKIEPHALGLDSLFETYKGRRVFFYNREREVFLRKDRALRFLDCLLLDKEVALVEATAVLYGKLDKEAEMSKQRVEKLLQMSTQVAYVNEEN